MHGNAGQGINNRFQINSGYGPKDLVRQPNSKDKREGINAYMQVF